MSLLHRLADIDCRLTAIEAGQVETLKLLQGPRFVRAFTFLFKIGPKGEITTMSKYFIGAGAALYYSAVFADAAGKVNSLASLPSVSESTGTLKFSPVSTTGNPPAVTDPSFCWQVSCPAGTPPGDFSVGVSGANPDGTTDNTTDTFTVPDDDTVVTTSVSATAPAGSGS